MECFKLKKSRICLVVTYFYMKNGLKKKNFYDYVAKIQNNFLKMRDFQAIVFFNKFWNNILFENKKHWDIQVYLVMFVVLKS